MTDITCDMCADLFPLVLDGVASEDSAQAVNNHIKNCEKCRMLYGNDNLNEVNDLYEDIDLNKKIKDIFRSMKKYVSVAIVSVMISGMIILNTELVFYNIIIMPLLGVRGYIVFKWKSIYIMPLLLIISYVILSVLHFAITGSFLTGILSFVTPLYLFIFIGIVIAGLLKFAFEKENIDEK